MRELAPNPTSASRRLLRIPDAIFFDVDRCAVDTMRAFSIAVEATAYNTPLTAKQLYDEYERAKRSGESYNVVGFINHSLEGTGYSWQANVERDFIERGRGHDLLMKHARKVIDYAVAEDMLLAMFTYGASSPDRNDQKWADAKAWQLAKISAAGLDDLPAYVCNQKDKAAKIMKWYEEGDGFYLPASMSPEVDLQTVARRIILLDDKTASFASLMRPLFGIRVTPEDEANQHDFQSGHLPGGVVAVHGMIEALGAIKAFRSVVAD